MTRTSYWINEADHAEIVQLLHKAASRNNIHGDIETELSVAKTRFDNGSFKALLGRVLGKDSTSVPVKLSEPEREALFELPLSDSLRRKLEG